MISQRSAAGASAFEGKGAEGGAPCDATGCALTSLACFAFSIAFFSLLMVDSHTPQQISAHTVAPVSQRRDGHKISILPRTHPDSHRQSVRRPVERIPSCPRGIPLVLLFATVLPCFLFSTSDTCGSLQIVTVSANSCNFLGYRYNGSIGGILRSYREAMTLFASAGLPCEMRSIFRQGRGGKTSVHAP